MDHETGPVNPGRLRIAILSSVHLPTDARIFHRQATALAAAGHEVRFFVPCDGGERTVDGVDISPIPPTPRRWQRPANWWRLYRGVVRFEPDVVHFHDPELLFIVPLLRFSSMNSVAGLRPTPASGSSEACYL